MAEFWFPVMIDCPDCQSKRTVKCGKQSGHQRYLCKDCKKKFRYNKVEGRKFDAEVIGLALRLYFSGNSLKQICEAIRDKENISEPAKDTVFQWVREFTDVATELMKDYKARSSDEWVADEIVVRCGGRKMYHWNVMDKNTKYMYASHLSTGRGMKDARKVMQMALDAADRPPKKITTDGWHAYKKPIAELMPDTEHNVSQGIRSVHNNNNVSERVQGTFRDREITLRGLDTLETGQRFLQGWKFHYNMFKEHETLKFKTPAEVAFEQPPFREWADVVRTGKRCPEINRERTPKTGISKIRTEWDWSRSKKPKANVDAIVDERPARPQQMGFPELLKIPTPSMEKPKHPGRRVTGRTKAKPRSRRRG